MHAVFSLLVIGLRLSLAEFKDDDIRSILTRLIAQNKELNTRLTDAEAQNREMNTRLSAQNTDINTRLTVVEAENRDKKHTAARLNAGMPLLELGRDVAPPFIYSC